MNESRLTQFCSYGWWQLLGRMSPSGYFVITTVWVSR